ncbi:MAG: hypothetical protein E7047_07870 [Lentisphaerae bacterium]|nr:hypothetical protein [Lentisphaerota bacterium]
MVRPTAKKFFVSLLAGLATAVAGCISANYHGEDFPPTDSIKVLGNTPGLAEQYRIIGRGEASGEFSAVSNLDLQNRLCELGQAHGAEALVIVGTRIVPAGRIADATANNIIQASDDPDQLATQIAFNEDISADPDHAARDYKRIMYALFLRKK